MNSESPEAARVLMFSPAYDLAGGAVIAANRLFHAFRQKGLHARMLVGKSSFENDLVQEVRHNLAGEKILSRLTQPLGLNYIHYYSSFSLPKHKFFREANILNFHTIHSGYFNYLALPKLTRLKPAVFTLHDAWSFTGHCGVSFDCQRWKTGCGKCPYPNNYPPIKRDATNFEWKLKKRTYRKSHLTFVTPSRWLASLAKQSMIGEHEIHTIPYGLDTAVFEPLNAEHCREVLGIPQNKKVLLFGAMGLTERGKGGDLLVKALRKIPDSLKKSIVLVTLGQADEAFRGSIDIQTINLGYVSGDRMKAVALSAADIFIFPTRSDNHPCIVQESLACGTPIVSFNVTGVPELVRPGETGYLAEPENADSFLGKIMQLLEEDQVRAEMKLRCRQIALAEYRMDIQADRYNELFQSILNKN
jgi:glycosyltransferase involved in cell wall biosynthesis